MLTPEISWNLSHLPKARRLGFLSLVGMAIFLGELATHLSLMLPLVFCKWVFGEGFGGNTEPHRVFEALGFGKKQQPFGPGQIPKGFENWPLCHDLVDLPCYKVLEDSETQPTTRRKPKGGGRKKRLMEEKTDLVFKLRCVLCIYVMHHSVVHK